MAPIDSLFARLRSAKRTAFMPFVTAGDPDMAFTRAVLDELARRGAHLCEVGIPYSDPIADGPVIQESYTRALASGFRLSGAMEMLGEAAHCLEVPLVTMVSYAIIHRHGVNEFVDETRAAGLAGIIVPDLPVDEADRLADRCRRREVSLIQLVTPTTARDRALRIAETSTGFLYFVSVTGITGERQELPSELVDNIGWLRSRTHLPVCVGFGISTPEHVRKLSPIADGIIVGSAVVRRIACVSQRPADVVLREVGDYVATLIDALDS